MKILITGGSGFLGQYLNIELSKENKILTLYNSQPGNCAKFNSARLNLTNYEKLQKLFEDFLPEIVIHSAAISTPQLADSLPAKDVYNINVNVAKKISELCNEFNSKLIYTSTDLVYAGYRGSLLNENSKLIPISLYAETKLMGEVKIQETFNNYIILRTALLYGFGLNKSNSHFQKMYNNFKSGKKVKLFTDQFRSPLSVLDATKIISEICRKDIKGEIINFGGKERVSRLELGEKLCKLAGLDRNLIEPISMDDIPGFPKVADVSMNTEKLQSYGLKQKTIEESIKEIINKYEGNNESFTRSS